MRRLAGRENTVSFGVRIPQDQEERFLSELRVQFPRLFIQLLSLRHQPNSRVIEMIAKQTIRSIGNRSLLASRPELDLLLRLAGTTQISEAIAKVGYKKSGRKVLVAVGTTRDLRRLEKLAGEKGETFKKSRVKDLSAADLETIEGAALLGVTRS
jgi:tRNA threonylcarbamoyladenosine modification (KEOPS) complex Cgi121 subunit